MSRHQVTAAALICLAATAAADLAAAESPLPKAPPPQCFYSNEWNGWKATPDAKAIYIKVGVNRLYRLDLRSECPELLAPGAHLITTMHGTGAICTALDIDLKVSDMPGFAIPCIVSKITPLSPDEATALPKKLRP